MSSKQQLLADLQASGEAALARLSALAPERFEQGRYENGWNGRQILAHIASIEWTYARLIEIAAAPMTENSSESRERAAATRGGIDSYNARQVEKRADATVKELLDEFRANRRKTIAAVAAADEALFDVPIRSAGGRSGTLARVLNEVAVEHVSSHSLDIAG